MAEAKTTRARITSLQYMNENDVYLSDERGEYIEVSLVDKSQLPHRFYPYETPDHIQKRAMFHGFNQKIRDAAAKKEETGTSWMKMMNVIDCLEGANGLEPSWDKKREPAKLSDEELAEAIARALGKKMEWARKKVADSNEEEREGLVQSPKVKAALLDLRAEKAKATAASIKDDALDALLGDDDEEEDDEKAA